MIKKFITQKLLEHSSLHPKVLNCVKYVPYQFNPWPHTHPRSEQFSKMGTSENENKSITQRNSKNPKKSFDFFPTRFVTYSLIQKSWLDIVIDFHRYSPK